MWREVADYNWESSHNVERGSWLQLWELSQCGEHKLLSTVSYTVEPWLFHSLKTCQVQIRFKINQGTSSITQWRYVRAYVIIVPPIVSTWEMYWYPLRALHVPTKREARTTIVCTHVIGKCWINEDEWMLYQPEWQLVLLVAAPLHRSGRHAELLTNSKRGEEGTHYRKHNQTRTRTISHFV